ncbi:hypothetical protein O181_050998 [Austropuccinia psidii MF-1]|uniref:Uncharacterized protein n=1 Tax=Austropuccinia psidii MF-1 TaxID=1389203 RepID=A0A9Q3HMX1_9BASI|nr:hypothetical protein [Austropuccinia psidii MF-1]
MASINGKEKMMLLTAAWSKTNPPSPKQVPRTAPAARRRNSNAKKQPQAQNKGKGKAPATKPYIQGYRIPKTINDMKSHISDKNPSICNNVKTNNFSLSQINETLMCFEKVSRKIKIYNNDNSFGNKLKEKSAIIEESTDKYFKFNIDDIIETRIKQAINIIEEDDNKVLDDISNSFTEVKKYTTALKKCFDTSQEEVSKLTLKLNQVISDNTRQKELWKELKHKEDMYKIEVINLMQSFQHEFRNFERCRNSKMNDIEQLLHTLSRMSTPLNKNEGTRIPNPQVLDVENSQLKNKFSTSLHNLDPSMGQALLKEVPKLKEWPHFSGEGEYDHMELIRGIHMIKEILNYQRDW